MRFWSMIAVAATLAVVASAQVAKSSPPTMVMPITGVPLSVETIGEHITKNPDGTSITGIGKTRVYRDAAGRMRLEMEFPDPSGEPLMIQLADPVDGFIAVLETPAKIAHRLKFPKTDPFLGLAMQIGGQGLINVPGTKTRKTENLGKQTIEGIEFGGSRTTTTSDNQPSLIAVDERWMSKEFGLIGLLKYSGPDGETNSSIQNLNRTAPDPALFAIPTDYRVEDLEFSNPVQ
jgi:hypothetical protein